MTYRTRLAILALLMTFGLGSVSGYALGWADRFDAEYSRGAEDGYRGGLEAGREECAAVVASGRAS